MAYFTREDLVLAAGGDDALVQLTDWDHDGVPDENVIDQFTLLAEGILDSFAVKYETPIARPNKAVRLHSSHQAIWLIADKRNTVTDNMERMRAIREHWYERLSLGLVAVSDAPRSSLPVVESHVVTASSLPESPENSGYR